MNTLNKKIYLDYNATTPVDSRVLNKMLPYFTEHFGNPSSANHSWGWAAESAVKKSREQIASLLNCKANEIIFTSGATESNNWVISGLIQKIKRETTQQPIHILTSAVEHSSITNALKAAQASDIEVEFLPVNSYGQVEISTIEKHIRPTTKLMTFIWVNNEIGSINPIQKIGELARQHQIYFHSDATQAIGKVPIDLQNCPVDMLSFSGHKIYGPKGIGALYLRQNHPHVEIDPLLYGGGQERGHRSGTLNVPGIVGMGEACAIYQQEMTEEINKTTELRDLLIERFLSEIPGTQINGHPKERAANNISVTFNHKSIDLILPKLSPLGISMSSACSSGRTQMSHVLKAIGLSEPQAHGTLRISFGRFTTKEDLDIAFSILKEAFQI